jgi:hypothetical protein
MKKIFEAKIIDENGPYCTQFETAGDPYVWVWGNLDPDAILYIRPIDKFTDEFVEEA